MSQKAGHYSHLKNILTWSNATKTKPNLHS